MLQGVQPDEQGNTLMLSLLYHRKGAQIQMHTNTQGSNFRIRTEALVLQSYHCFRCSVQ